MDYIQPPNQMAEILTIAKVKANLSIPAMLIRGAMSGMVLGFAILFAFKCSLGLEAPYQSLIGSLVFPAGFAIITLLGLELVTGNYAVVTIGWLRNEVSGKQLGRNLFFVGLGNLIGSLLFAFLIAYTLKGLNGNQDPLVSKIIQVAQDKTLVYQSSDGLMMATCKGILCNTLVGLAAVLGLTSQSSIGRLGSIWFPVAMFFALGFEHSVVNMFVIPCGMILGANVSVSDWLTLNLLPVSIGNIIGASVIVAGGIHWSTPKSS